MPSNSATLSGVMAIIASEPLSSAMRKKPNGPRRMPGMPKSPMLGNLVITGRPTPWQTA